MSVLCASPAAIGIRATMVPTLVPIQSEVTHAAKNRPASANRAGSRCKVRSTMALAAPISLALAAKAPASMKIQTMSNRFLLPAPEEKTATRSDRLPRETATLTIAVTTKMNSNGALLTPFE